MDNLALYQQQLAATRNAQHEKERLREDLHDLVLGNLAVISRVVEVALSCLESAGTEVKQQLKAAQDLASDTARQVREFLWILDPAHDSWDELCSHLHRWGHELMEKVGLDFTLAVTPAVLVLPPPSVSMKVCVERGYKEALVNIVKHAQAQMVRGTLSCRADTLVCEIHNNGNGFDPDATTEGHYGLSLIRKRVQELGGELTIDAKVGQGTRITLRLALR
jgi:signal transduction histidine kinase